MRGKILVVDDSLRMLFQVVDEIDQIFDAIHSHPLQTLNIILRKVQSDENLLTQEFVSKLQQLNQELRDVYDLVKREVVSELDSFYFQQKQILDLSQPTRLEVICTQEHGKNVIRVADNGLKIETIADLSSHLGFGTKLAQNLAKQLGGEFKRYPHSPKGIVCQLTWSANKLWFWRLF